MAPSDLSGWGLFALKDFSKNETPLYGDVVIAMSDAHPIHAAGMQLLIHDYLWDPRDVGQQYEGQAVMSVLPGVGMLANGHNKHYSLLHPEPAISDAGVTRDAHPAAGSFTLYHNHSFHLQHSVSAGEELFVTYGESWFQERKIALDDPPPLPKDVEWLRTHGYCVDNLKPGISAGKGRGAFATRHLSKGFIVAPVPVLPLTRKSLEVQRPKVSGQVVETQQLLLNYCLGHVNSSLLLYPYSPLFNLVNHSFKAPNVRLQWADNQESLEWPFLSKSSPGILLELVALQDIQEGDEVLLDYGDKWQTAWEQHVQQWTPRTESYVPSFRFSMDMLHTEEELQQEPYPHNLLTSCFYRYRVDEHASSERVTMDQWKEEDLMDLRNLRPCAVLGRHPGEDSSKERNAAEWSWEFIKDKNPVYTVQIRNTFGLKPEERPPKGRAHVVTHVPRRAIRFSDKLYTTDPYLEDAFRHNIGVPSFPLHWMDLA